MKALSLVWRRLPQFGPHNTLHVDDLARNFALNPANGIKIKAYREDMYVPCCVMDVPLTVLNKAMCDV